MRFDISGQQRSENVQLKSFQNTTQTYYICIQICLKIEIHVLENNLITAQIAVFKRIILFE